MQYVPSRPFCMPVEAYSPRISFSDRLLDLSLTSLWRLLIFPRENSFIYPFPFPFPFPPCFEAHSWFWHAWCLFCSFTQVPFLAPSQLRLKTAQYAWWCSGNSVYILLWFAYPKTQELFSNDFEKGDGICGRSCFLIDLVSQMDLFLISCR